MDVCGTGLTNPLSALRLLAPSLTSAKVGQASRLASPA